MKKTISLILTVVMLFSCMAILASADGFDYDEMREFSPRYKKLSNCWAGLDATGGGWYDVTGGAGSANGTVSISVTVILQRFNTDSITFWDDIVTLTDTNQYSASCGTSRYIATTGVYRTHTIANVYDRATGDFIETATANSDHITIK